jgi:integrase
MGIKIKDIDMERQTIFIPAQSSKNGTARIGTMPDYLIGMLKRMNIEQYDPSWYLFSEGFSPGRKKVDSRKVAKRWEKLRSELKLPMSIKFYSLRDSGIIQMLEQGISAEYVRQQADHSSLDMTTIYSKHARPDGIEQIKHKIKGF